MKIEVFGSGIIALSTAVRAQELGHQATIRFTNEAGQKGWHGFLETAKATSTSWAAAAFWTPFATGNYKRAWALDTLHRFRSIAQEVDRCTGVTIGAAYFYYQNSAEIVEARKHSLWWLSDPLTFMKDCSDVTVEPKEVRVGDTMFRFRIGCRFRSLRCPVTCPTWLSMRTRLASGLSPSPRC